MSSSPQPPAACAPPPYTPPLPVDVLRRVLRPHAGDVATLCAAACVASAWRDAAARTPGLWRAPRLWQLPHAAALRLTDEWLAALLARAAGSLERLSGFPLHTAVTVAGVAAALRGQQLTQLCVRGVKRGAEGGSAEEVEALLRSFLCHDRSRVQLDDVAPCAFCCAPDEAGAPCGRLCSRVYDVTCRTCDDVVYCEPCAARAKDERAAPCGHLCSKCLEPHHGRVFVCGECEEGAEPRCANCKCYCDEAPPCACCGHACGERYFCSICGTPHCKDCRWGRGLLRCCDVCDELFCADHCARGFARCRGGNCGGKSFCRNCAGECLHTLRGAPLCDECAVARSSDEDAEEDEEEEEAGAAPAA
jgi:hypothetical protein